MIVQDFTLEKYDWHVTGYYHITSYYTDEITEKLKRIDCNEDFLKDARECMNKDKLNTGFCYSNLKEKKSVIVISKTNCPAQFMNSYDHERSHLARHIEQKFDIDPYGEESAYLVGKIGQLMFPKIKKFLCDCYKED